MKLHNHFTQNFAKVLKSGILILLCLVSLRAQSQAPTITNFSPSSGPVGTVVTITGTNLGTLEGLYLLSIGGMHANPLTNTGTQITAMVMPGAVTGGVTVTTASGTVNSGSSFTVNASTNPGAGWSYYRNISLTSGTPQANYQVRVGLSVGEYSNIQSSGNDLRFFDNSNVPCSYWIETWNTSGASVIWVNVTTSGSTSIRMYYGNGSASAASNGDATFIMFDDFLGTAVNTSKWDSRTTVNGTLSVSAGSLTLAATTDQNSTSQVIGKTFTSVANGMFMQSWLVSGTTTTPTSCYRGSYAGFTNLSGTGTTFTQDITTASLNYAVVTPGRNGNTQHAFQNRSPTNNTSTEITSVSVPNSYAVGVNTGDCRNYLNPASNNPTADNTHTTNTPTGNLYPILSIHRADAGCSPQRAVSTVVDRISVRKFDNTYSPSITMGSEIAHAVTFSSTTSITDLNMVSGSSVEVNNDVTLTVTGTLSYSGGTLTIGNTNIVIAGALDVTGGATLTTGGKITLASGGRIADLSNDGGGSISGNITIERLIPGSRKFRLLSHPFTTAQNLDILTDDIDITGNTTGVTNGNAKTLGTGFTATTGVPIVNNPSAFWFNTANANGQTNDGGWSAFTAADGSGSNNTWDVGEGIRILMRGAKGQGLNSQAYTPSNVTIDMTGAVNTGNVNVNLVTGGTGGTSGFNLIGNPYASPIDISAVVWSSAGQASINKTIYTRNPQTGSFTPQLLSNGTPYAVPAYAAMFIRNTGGSTVTLPFTEARKAASSSLTTKKNGITHNSGFECKIGGSVYENFTIAFDKDANSIFEDRYDAMKLNNDSFNMSTITSDGKYASTDIRPYINEGKIKLFTNIKSGSTQVEISAANFGLNSDEALYFVDELSKTTMPVNSDFKYTFTIDATNEQTFGSERFYFMAGKPTSVNEVAANTQFCTLSPNPANELIQLSLSTANDGNYTYGIYNQLGQAVLEGVCQLSNGKASTIHIAELKQGVYFIRISNGSQQQTIKFIK